VGANYDRAFSRFRAADAWILAHRKCFAGLLPEQCEHHMCYIPGCDRANELQILKDFASSLRYQGPGPGRVLAASYRLRPP
jgi:hypothetical protein